jgi:hypothetical protein
VTSIQTSALARNMQYQPKECNLLQGDQSFCIIYSSNFVSHSRINLSPPIRLSSHPSVKEGTSRNISLYTVTEINIRKLHGNKQERMDHITGSTIKHNRSHSLALVHKCPLQLRLCIQYPGRMCAFLVR